MILETIKRIGVGSLIIVYASWVIYVFVIVAFAYSMGWVMGA